MAQTICIIVLIINQLIAMVFKPLKTGMYYRQVLLLVPKMFYLAPRALI